MLIGARQTEIGTAAIALDPVECPAIQADCDLGLGVNRPLEVTEILRVEVVQELGRPDDVIEQGRDVPALTGKRTRRHAAMRRLDQAGTPNQQKVRAPFYTRHLE